MSTPLHYKELELASVIRESAEYVLKNQGYLYLYF
jgi:hypothetical protein